jgi:hypothetical protein
MSGLPPTAPELDWSSWSGLGNALRQKYRVVRELTDPLLPTQAAATWMFANYTGGAA